MSEHDASALRTSNSWSVATLCIALVFIARFIYLVWFSPYQLLGDEAYYWAQARHLDLSYDEKGPLLAWMIAGCCRLFGDTEWAVRLPMAAFSAVAAWGVGRLAMSLRHDGSSERVGLFAVVIFLLLPAFQANAQICTQDGPLIAVWIALTAIGLRLLRRLQHQRSTWVESIMFWIVMGVGVLLKQSVLLFLVSFPAYVVIARPKAIRWRTLIAQQIVGILIFVIVVSPMILWDARHGWPMVAHTLGHLGAGGDQAGHENSGNAFLWLCNTIGGIVGAFGPACIILMIWAAVRAQRLKSTDDQKWRDRMWLISTAAPSTAFFILLSLRKPVVPSWPLPALVSMVPLIAELASDEWNRYRETISAWRVRCAAGIGPKRALKKPDTPFHQLWVVMVVYGIGGAMLLAFPNMLARVPILGPRIAHSVLKRFSGHREAAADLANQLATIVTPDHRPPVIVTRHYMAAALYSFYLPDHPSVCTAGRYLGKRSTTFDNWADTDLSRLEFRGRTLLLDGQGDVTWDRALIFDRIEPIANGRYFLASNFGGPRPDHPRFLSE